MPPSDPPLAPLRLLVLGGGAIVSECHLPALRALSWLDACEVVEPYARNADALRARFPSVRVSSQPYEEIVADPSRLRNFDAALIALPNTLHLDATLRCLAAGLHVLCEKPLALTAEECRQVESAMKQHNRMAAAAMVRRFTPSLTALREAVQRGMIGELVSITLEHGCFLGVWPSDTETVLRKDQGGCLVNMGVHFLDYLEWIFGDLTPVSYTDDLAGGIEVNCDFRLQTAAGVPLALRISWTHELSNVLRVEGTKGSLTMDLGSTETTLWRSSDGTVDAAVRAPRPFASGDWQPTFEACFVEQFYQFAAAIRNLPGTVPPVTPEQAAHAHELIEWAYSHRPAPVRDPRSALRPALPPAPVVVTGGTGFVGSHLVERLAELEMSSITVPVRSFRTGSFIARFPMSMKRTDLTRLDDCRAAFRGAKHVFHLAYGSSGSGELAQFTIDSTRTVLQAALAEGVESVVVFGTCSVWTGHQDGEINEDSPPNPSLGDYGDSKLKVHQETLEFARQHPQMRVTIVAPGAVYGPRGGLFCATPCTLAKAGTFAWFDSGKGICNHVHVSNLVDLAILAAQSPKAHGRLFIAVDGSHSWREFLGPLVAPWSNRIRDISGAELAALKNQPKRSGTLRDVVRAMLNAPGVMAAISRQPVLGGLKDWFTRQFPSRHRQVQQMRPAPEFIHKSQPGPPEPALWTADIFGPAAARFSSRRARELLGWKPLIDLEEGQSMSINWLRDVANWK